MRTKVLIFAALAARVLAQDNAPPDLPPGPLLKPAPDFSTWTVTTKIVTARGQDAAEEGPADGQGNPADKRVTVTKTGNIRKEEKLDQSGGRTESWTFGGYTVTLEKDSDVPTVGINPTAKDSKPEAQARKDFPGFEWISAKNFAGVVPVSGKDCLVFRGQTPGDEQTASYTAVAGIDAQTRLPVSLALGEERKVFEFGPPPTAALVLPQGVKDAIDSWKSHLDVVSRPPPRP